MNWTLLVTKPAKKALEKLPSRDQIRIERVLALMERNPFVGDIKRLEPSGWRRRVGNYRIYYDLYMDERSIVVTAVLRRMSKTY